jgi:hypothetical protein
MDAPPFALMILSGRRDPPNGLAREEVSICSAKNPAANGEGHGEITGKRSRTRSNRSPLSAAMVSGAKTPETTGSGFPWKSGATEFTNPTPVPHGLPAEPEESPATSLKGVKTLVRDGTTRGRLFLGASADDPFL